MTHRPRQNNHVRSRPTPESPCESIAANFAIVGASSCFRLSKFPISKKDYRPFTTYFTHAEASQSTHMDKNRT